VWTDVGLAVAVLIVAAAAACSSGATPHPSGAGSIVTIQPTTEPASGTTSTVAPVAGDVLSLMPGSTRKICTLTGAPTAAEAAQTQPAERFGLASADRGYSFLYQGDIWYLFGDSRPTRDFPAGSTTLNAATRYPLLASGLDNDAVAYAAPTPPAVCPTLEFIPRKTAPVGSFISPSVVLDGRSVSLRTNETPVAGIAEDGRMYVVFATGNRCDLPSPPTSLGCTGSAGGFGHSTQSVIGVLDDEGTLQFERLYDLSSPTTPYGNHAKFVMVALQQAPDGYIYIWGTAGGSSFRHSAPFLGRVPASDIATQSAITYYQGETASGTPIWASQQSDALALFNDSPNCMGELGVEWIPYVNRWMMLYNCLDDSPGHPRGIWMRTAPQPWGPWSDPQTIFRAATDGFCVVMDKPTCAPPYNGATGGEYGPYFIAGWTTSTSASRGQPASTTIYYTVDTFVPYGEVIEESTIVGSRGPTDPP